jgi:3-hydroxyisobutyrate dehydrogenase-like beta-hydroxyacid dehydrogenase
MSGARPSVGFIGLGAMGGPMSLNILSGGFRLAVNDTSRDAASALLHQGATWAGSPREIAEQSDVVLTCLPSVEAVEKVAIGPDGVLSGLRKGQAHFEMSTSSPRLVARLHAAFLQKGVHFLDAPITGGAIGARNGKLTIFVGGDKASFERFAPVLATIGDRLIHVGPSGTGIVTKLVNNCASQTVCLALAEIFALGLKAGAAPLPLWEALRSGAAGRRRTFDGMIDEFLPAHYSPPHAALSIYSKDMMLATELGRDLNVPMRFANLALAEYTEAMSRGLSDQDGRVAMTLPLERVNVKVAEDPEAIDEILRRDPPAASDSKRGAERGRS